MTKSPKPGVKNVQFRPTRTLVMSRTRRGQTNPTVRGQVSVELPTHPCGSQRAARTHPRGLGATPVHRRRSALHQTDRQSGSLSTGRSGRMDCGKVTYQYARCRCRPLTLVHSTSQLEADASQDWHGVAPSGCTCAHALHGGRNETGRVTASRTNSSDGYWFESSRGSTFPQVRGYERKPVGTTWAMMYRLPTVTDCRD